MPEQLGASRWSRRVTDSHLINPKLAPSCTRGSLDLGLQDGASVNYLRDSAEGFPERITGTFGRIISTTRQYCVTRISGAASGSGTVRVVDTEPDSVVVVSVQDALLVEYDSNDQFTVGSKAANYSEFEDDLSVGDTLAYRISGSAASTVNTFTLTNR